MIVVAAFVLEASSDFGLLLKVGEWSDQEDINCPDVPHHAGRPHADVFGTDCGVKVSELWPGAPGVKLETLCPCSCGAMATCGVGGGSSNGDEDKGSTDHENPRNNSAFQPVERVALGNDPQKAAEIFSMYFKQRRPVIITDAISRKQRRQWGIANQLKKFGGKGVVVTTQPPGWIDTRHTNFHAIHEYIKTNTEIGVGWGPLMDVIGLSPTQRTSEDHAAAVSRLGKSEFWRKPADRRVNIDWFTAELYVRTNLPSDHKGDDLGPALERLVSVPPLILDALSEGGYLPPAPPGPFFRKGVTTTDGRLVRRSNVFHRCCCSWLNILSS